MMEPRTLQYLADACHAEVSADSAAKRVSAISTDSRDISPGSLFVALSGDRFDGHDFLTEAERKGAAAILVEKEGRVRTPALPTLQAADSRAALGQIAARYRRDFKLPMVAVCGSNGKSSTKELIASVLSEQWRTLFSPASFNNDIGVPLTLLHLNSGHEAAVLEVGTNHPGELRPLLAMIQPEYGVVTSLGREHLEHFKSLKGVIEEEGTLADHLPPHGILFINSDDEGWEGVAKRCRAKVIRIGTRSNAEWKVEDARASLGGTSFYLRGPGAEWSGRFEIRLIGRHFALNAAIAAVVGHQWGMDPETIRKGLMKCDPLPHRMEVSMAGDVALLDDSYNSNVESTRAALTTLSELAEGRRSIAALGDMAELGAASESLHREAAQIAAQCGINNLFTVGSMSRAMADAARHAGLDSVQAFESVEHAIPLLRNFLKAGDILLIKASRASRLERIREALTGGSSYSLK